MNTIHRNTAAIAFLNTRQLLTQATLNDVALTVKRAYEGDPHAQILVFDAVTSHVIDLDLRGTDADIIDRFPLDTRAATNESEAETISSENTSRSRGRPKLGVVPREITLLPRHWDWLNQQPGGASVALRKLVEEAKRNSEAKQQVRLAMESAYRFMAGIAGDQLHYEEASRALFAGDREGFLSQLVSWPEDVKAHLVQLADHAFSLSA